MILWNRPWNTLIISHQECKIDNLKPHLYNFFSHFFGIFMMKATIRGTEIYFDIAGMKVEAKGNKLIEKPTLFLLHGGPGGNHLHFKTDSIKLQDVAQLVFIDQRGCGFSKKTKTSEYTLDNNIEDIEALRKHLGLKKICLLGHSYGGIVAQGYAIRYGKNVDKLILSATAPSHHFIDEAKETLQKIGSKAQINICNKYLWKGKFKNERDVAHYFKVMDSLYYFGKKRRKKFKPANKELKNVFSHEVLNAGFSTFLHHFNFIPRLKNITCPTLILSGQKDWICNPAQSKILAKHIKKSRLKIFKNCSHIIQMDAADQYIKTVKKFLL